MTFENAYIIAVDDDEIIRSAIETQLEAYTVVCVDRFDQALVYLSQVTPVLLIFDIHLDDDVSGIDLAEELRSFDMKNIPILFFSSDDSNKISSRAESLNNVYFASKKDMASLPYIVSQIIGF